MVSIRPLPEFTAWLNGLTDAMVRGVVVARIKRLELGLAGDVKPVGEGVSELRIQLGAGWRIYFARQGAGGNAGVTGESMKKRTKVADLPAFDAAPYLDSEEAVAAYLTDVIEANDASLLAAALGDIARARGMTEIARSAGITREALYKALRPDSAPRFETVRRVCAALGVRLVVQAGHSG